MKGPLKPASYVARTPLQPGRKQQDLIPEVRSRTHHQGQGLVEAWDKLRCADQNDEHEEAQAVHQRPVRLRSIGWDFGITRRLAIVSLSTSFQRWLGEGSGKRPCFGRHGLVLQESWQPTEA